MRIKLFGFFLFSGLFLLTSSCQNRYQKILKSTDYELKFRKAKEYYNDEKFVKAIPLFEDLISIYKGTKDVEDLYYYYAWCYYGQGDYIFAAYYFKNFLDFYPRSIDAEQAKYMIAYCNYKMSPNSDLDQEYTLKALDAFQLFVNTYPESEKVEGCNELMDELRRKQEKKAYNSAVLYYNIREYRAAANAFNRLLLDFPESQKREEIQYLTVKSYFLLAENSIQDKKMERYNLTVSAYMDFLNRFDSSEYIRELEKIYQDSLEKLENLQNS